MVEEMNTATPVFVTFVWDRIELFVAKHEDFADKLIKFYMNGGKKNFEMMESYAASMLSCGMTREQQVNSVWSSYEERLFPISLPSLSL